MQHEARSDASGEKVVATLWRAEREAFLASSWPTRSVPRMHLQRYTNYRLQHHLPNPLNGSPAA